MDGFGGLTLQSCDTLHFGDPLGGVVSPLSVLVDRSWSKAFCNEVSGLPSF